VRTVAYRHLVLLFVTASCGDAADRDGSVIGPGSLTNGSIGSGSDPASTSEAGPGQDGADPFTTVGPTFSAGSITCTPSSGLDGLNSAGECEYSVQETCGDVSYEVACACPQETCVCFGSSTSVVPFDGCPVCPTTEYAFGLCAFPHP
jgi:hypothetical protein